MQNPVEVDEHLRVFHQTTHRNVHIRTRTQIGEFIQTATETRECKVMRFAPAPDPRSGCCVLSNTPIIGTFDTDDEGLAYLLKHHIESNGAQGPTMVDKPLSSLKWGDA